MSLYQEIQTMLAQMAGICPTCRQKRDDINGYLFGIMCPDCAAKIAASLVQTVTESVEVNRTT